VITPSPTHAGDGHSTLGLVRADCSSAGSSLALDLQPFRLKVNQICAVVGTFTNNSVISLDIEICSYRILERFTGNCEDDRLRFDNSAALSSRRHSVTGEGKPFVRQIAHIRLQTERSLGESIHAAIAKHAVLFWHLDGPHSPISHLLINVSRECY
jgi:hypothetical protein